MTRFFKNVVFSFGLATFSLLGNEFLAYAEGTGMEHKGIPISTASTYNLTADEIISNTGKAESGDKDAAFRLYLYYALSKKDIDNEMKFLTIAAEEGHVIAQMNLARTHFHNKEFDNAEKWALIAKESGCNGKEGSDECRADLLLTEIKEMKSKCKK